MRRSVWPKEEPTEWEDALRSFAVINEIHGSRWRYDDEETITNRR